MASLVPKLSTRSISRLSLRATSVLGRAPSVSRLFLYEVVVVRGSDGGGGGMRLCGGCTNELRSRSRGRRTGGAPTELGCAEQRRLTLVVVVVILWQLDHERASEPPQNRLKSHFSSRNSLSVCMSASQYHVFVCGAASHVDILLVARCHGQKRCCRGRWSLFSL